MLAVLVSAPGVAQTIPANETDLRASYCVGISQRLIEMNNKALSQVDNSKFGQAAADEARREVTLFQVNGRAEMSLHVLAYNLKRLMQILGIAETIRILRA